MKKNILHKQFFIKLCHCYTNVIHFFLYILVNWVVRPKRLSNIRIHYAQNINGITLSFMELCDRLQVGGSFFYIKCLLGRKIIDK